MPVSASAPPRLPYPLRLLWAGPVTLFGLALALPVLLAGGHRHVVKGSTSALLFRGALADWMLRHHPAGRMRAMAIGHVIIAAASGLAPRTLTHELEHVRQAERWGPVFPFLYAGSGIWQWLTGRHAYRDNHFEVAARAAEDTASATLKT